MSRRLNETIELSKGADGSVAFLWRERRYRVLSVIARWREAREWWQGEGETRLYRVWASDGVDEGVFELAWLLPAREWRLVRVLD
jgi:hypothetical protein